MLIPLGDDLQKPDIPWMAALLLAACVLVHVYAFRLTVQEVQTGERLAEDFVRTWAVTPAKVPLGEFHTLFTHMFLHGDMFHLIGNMLMLWVFAGSVEHGLGSIRFLVMYLAAGLAGGYLHTVMNPGETIPMIGASGAIFGVIGAYVVAFGAMANINALLILGPARMKITLPAGAYVFIWIIIDQLIGIVIETDLGGTGTAWYAHVGGFVAGAVSMLFLKEFVKSRMIINREGKLEFVEHRAAPRGLASAMAAAAANDVAGLPNECPHCKTALEDKDKLSDELYRCPNAGCKRLVYPTRLSVVS